MVQHLYFQVKSAFDLPRNGWTVWVNREKSAELKSTKTKTLNSYKIKYVVYIRFIRKKRHVT